MKETMKTAEEVLELSFGSDYYQLDEAGISNYILSAMEEYSSLRNRELEELAEKRLKDVTYLLSENNQLKEENAKAIETMNYFAEDSKRWNGEYGKAQARIKALEEALRMLYEDATMDRYNMRTLTMHIVNQALNPTPKTEGTSI
jgi:two-component sensor histidine kinase